MDFALTEQQQLIRTEVRHLARKFDWSYWRELDRSGEYPHAFFNEFAANGWVGAVIPTEYGGLGLSQTNYSRAAMVLGGHCGNLTALLSAHQSIGVPQPLLVFVGVSAEEILSTNRPRSDVSSFSKSMYSE